jgi:hypothetical protein
MTPIPVWRTSLAAVAVVMTHLGTWVRLSWLTVALYLLCHLAMGLLVLNDAETLVESIVTFVNEEEFDGGEVAEEQALALAKEIEGPANRLTLVNLLSMIVTLLAASQLFVVWCRFVAQGEDCAERWFVFRFGAREFEMMGALVILSLGLSLVFAVAMALSAVAVVLLDIAGYFLMALSVAALFVLTARLSLLLPQVACDGGLDLMKVWRRTEGSTWRICAVALNVGSFCAVLVLLWFILTGFLIGATAEINTPGDLVALAKAPPTILLGALTLLVLPAVNLFLVSMLGLLHAQLAAAPEATG